MTPPFDSSALSSAEKDALIATLLARIDELSKRLDALEKENAELRAKLKLPPKTPDNSSTPPARGQKGSDDTPPRPKGKAHPGAHRPLHPNPTRKRDVLAEQCQHCGAAVSGVVQAPVHAYDRIEIPEIKPDITQVTLHGGVCPCCSKRFRAAPPAELPAGSPFGPNLRAFAIYLRFVHAISLERLSRLMSDLRHRDWRASQFSRRAVNQWFESCAHSGGPRMVSRPAKPLWGMRRDHRHARP
jgi:transposase